MRCKIGNCIGKTQGEAISIPIMVTGLGDLITWEPSVGGVAKAEHLHKRQTIPVIQEMVELHGGIGH